MINLQAELEKYREQERLCATFLARYRYDEWETLDPEVKAKEVADFLAAQETYRIPFKCIKRKCWIKRALSVVAWGMCRDVEELTDEKIEEIIEEEDRFVAHLSEAFVRVFPNESQTVSNKVMPLEDYYKDLRRRYRRETAQNGYYAMIADAVSWGEYEGDVTVVIPPRILRLAGTMPALVLLAALYHYRKPGNGVVIQGDFNNWYDETLGNNGEQRLTNLVRKTSLVTSMRAGTEKNSPSRFFLAEELKWKQGEPGIAFEDDGCHLLSAQLRSFSNLLRLFPKRLAAMSDEQITCLAEIAKTNLRPDGVARLVAKPGMDGFYLDAVQAKRFVELFGADFGGDSFSLEDLRALPEDLRKCVFASAWKEADWLQPPYTKKMSETGKTLPLQKEQSKLAWSNALVLLLHLSWFESHICPKEVNGVYTYARVPMIGPDEAAEYGSDAKSEALFALFEETAAQMEQVQGKVRFRFKTAKEAGMYRYAIVTDQEKERKRNETNANKDRSAADNDGSAWWLHT